jgi:hypothetical protein
METFESRIWCTCGQLLLSQIGDGFVVTMDERRVWMRRKTDAFKCGACARRYELGDLAEFAPAIPDTPLSNP